MEAAIKMPVYPTGATKWILILTALTCALLEMIDATIVNVALPEISGGIGATRTEIAWVVTAYSIGNVIVIPLSGMLSNLFGRKNYFTASVIVFTFGSLMCGMSTTLWTLVIWRFIQGLAGGGLLSTAQSILIGAFPPEKINTANAIFGMGVIVGPIVGPLIGGYLVEGFSWHWIFFVNLPIGALAAGLSWLFVTNLEGNIKPQKIDWWGIGFLAIAVSSLQYVLEEGEINDWFSSAHITALSMIAVSGMVAFIWRELSIDYPAVNIRLLKSYNVAIGNILMLIVGAMLMASMFIFPLFVRTLLSWTSIQTGVSLMYLGLSCSVSIIIARKLLDKGINQKLVMITGISMIATYLLLMSLSSPDSHESNFMFPLIIGGFGMAFFMLPVLSMSLSGLQGKDLAQGTGLNNMLKRLGGAIGLALMNIYLNHQNAHVSGAMIGYVNAYNPTTTERITAFKQTFINAGYATDKALQGAWQMMGNVVQQQQLLVSYNNGYLMVGLVILICIPIILITRSQKKEKREPST